MLENPEALHSDALRQRLPLEISARTAELSCIQDKITPLPLRGCDRIWINPDSITLENDRETIIVPLDATPLYLSIDTLCNSYCPPSSN